MEILDFPVKKNINILALGAESVGIFAVYQNGNIFISENFSDLLDENDFLKYKKAVLGYCKKERIKLDVILTDLHPFFRTTIFGEELAKKYRIKHINVQHHIAHIFSAVGDYIINAKRQTPNAKFSNFDFNNSAFSVQNSAFFGLAMDGTGYGLDGNIWGSEVFKVESPFDSTQGRQKSKVNNLNIERIGSLEEQVMIGGDAAVREPARMLIAILAKLQTLNAKRKIEEKNTKEGIYEFVKKFYARNEFELLYNQLLQDFNCQKTTSTGRILDAVSVLLGFAGNVRNFKHEATKKLEENSSEPYPLEPKIVFSVIASPENSGRGNPANSAINTGLLRRSNDYIETPRNDNNRRMILQTTPLFEYLIKNIHKDKKRLAATAQLYITKGLYKIIQLQTKDYRPKTVFAAGGMTNNKIIYEYLEKQGVYLSKKIPRGDEGIGVGQLVYYLLNNY